MTTQELLTPDMIHQSELAHANRVMTMGKLTAAIAQEVRQPVAIMMMTAEAALHGLESRPSNVDDVRQALATVIEYGGRAAEIIAGVRDFVSNAPSRRERLDLNLALLDVVGLAGREVSRHGISLKLQLATGLLPVEGDRIQLQQVIRNLIRNAVGSLSSVEKGARGMLIRTEDALRDGVLVTVLNSGPRLDPQAADDTFDALRSSMPNGTGLAICRAIVEAHGGRMWVSANQPRGTAFHFTLPVVDPSKTNLWR